MASVEVIGAGIAGLCCAYVLASAGHEVTLRALSQGPDTTCCSWWAGGMLAPWVEAEAAEPIVTAMGIEGLAFWSTFAPDLVHLRGTLVVASARDVPDLRRFAKVTTQFSWLDTEALGSLEPDLAGRFSQGLFYEREAHVEPRLLMKRLLQAFVEAGGRCVFGAAVTQTELEQAPLEGWRVDARGLAARNRLPSLRGVKGEMLVVHAPDVCLSRPVRLLHPRIPLYVVPRDDHHFMIGASMLECEDKERATVRSIMELLSGAVVLHPGFGEAHLVEVGVDVRPSFPDNIPAVVEEDRVLYVNGMYRHGFLAAPSLAQQVLQRIEARL